MKSGRAKSAGGIPLDGERETADGREGPRERGAARSARGESFLADEEALSAIERRYPDGMTSAQIVEVFTDAGVRLSEATFRKWVQLGLLPRSRRVGRKGKHQGSLGLYPTSTVRMIAEVRRRMADGLTVEDIAHSRRLRDELEALSRGMDALLRGLGEQLAGSALPVGERRSVEKQLEVCGERAAELLERIGQVERRIVAPLEREARARAFGSGTSGGAGELL